MATNNAKTDWFENKVLTDYLVGKTLYIALYTTNPNEAGTGTEVSGGGYARKQVTFTVTGNTASNSAEVDFGQATADWGNISHWAVVTATTGGNMYYYGATENSGGVATTFTVNNGDTIKFPVGSITITEE